MNEQLKIIRDRISFILSDFDREHFDKYEKYIYEIEALTISIAGKGSDEYKNFINIFNSNSMKHNKIPYLSGLLSGLRNKLVLSGIKTERDSSWDDLLNPTIYKTSYKKITDGYYSEAVESAAKELNTRAKKFYLKHRNSELDGSDLFAHIFSSDENKFLLLAGNELRSQSGKDEQEGYRFLFMGVWKGIRNPKAHSNIVISRDEAIERIILISMLMNKFEECVKKAKLSE